MAVVRLSLTATLLQTGLVVAAGGEDPLTNLPLASAELYDPSANSWSSAGSMATARTGHTANLLTNGKVLVAGGTNAEAYIEAPPTTIASAELYDPVANSWASAASMSLARTDHTATLLSNGQVLVAGGAISSGSGYAASAELYNPVANTWSSAGSMATGRFGHTATLLPNGMVLVAGGVTGTATEDGPPIASAELYDPTANTWSAAASMANARVNFTATLLPNGNVLVAGGSGTAVGTGITAELYNPMANTWSPAASMPTSREFHTATLLSNGAVLVAGGEMTTSGLLYSAELYDPVANTWSSAGSMANWRVGFTATLLSNGVVLAAGGNESSTEAELYW
jgi:N-acetylneuraminic acid mutarotase